MCTICSSLRPYSDSCDYQGLSSDSAAANTISSAAAAPTASLDQLADYLVRGYWQDLGLDAFSFDTSVSNQISVNLTGLTAEGKQLARWALQAWEAVADLDFVETTGSANITFQDHQAGAFSSYFVSGSTVSAAVVNVSTDWLSRYGTELGSYGFQTYIHEIGHALGLGHLGNYDGSADYSSDATFANDSWQMSVMSYFDQIENTSITASKAEVVTAMLADVVAIQSIYGAAGSGSLTAGNTTYGQGHSLGSSWLGLLFDAIYSADPGASAVYDGGPVTATICDIGGYDIIDFSDDRSNQNVDLTPEGISNVYGLTGNLLIARGTLIEEYRAGSGNDVLRGNAADNLLDGGNGADVLYGSTGDDTLLGVGGYDRLYGEAGADRLSGNAGNDSLYGGSGDDWLDGGIGWDEMYGGADDDTLYGKDGYDTLQGDAGDDLLKGNAGNDTMDGGDGNDVLDGGIGWDEMHGGTGGDTLNGLDGYDELYGDGGRDTLNGNAGNDTMDGGAGNDVLDGGIGADEMHGGADNDRLYGKNGYDRLYGEAGNDTLQGNAGNDRLDGGDGDDRLNGGLGADIFVFGSGDDQVLDFQNNIDTLQFDAALWGGAALSANQILSQYASMVGGEVLFDFGGGNSLSVAGIGNLNSLADDIILL